MRSIVSRVVAVVALAAAALVTVGQHQAHASTRASSAA